jgi:N-acetylmuramoyl-L-alanine amidase
VAVVAAALLVVLLLASPAVGQDEPRYTVIVSGQMYTLPFQTVQGNDFLPLSTLAEIFRFSVQRDPVSEDLAMNIGRSRVGLSLRQPFASIDNRLVPLDAAPLQAEDGIWVSADFIEVAVGPALRQPVRADRGRRQIDVGGEKPLRVYMRSATRESGTRLIFEFSRKVPYTFRESRRKLYLTLDTASLQAPFEIEDIDSPVVRRIKLLRSEREKGFVIELTRQFGTYDLKETSIPPSLVVELRRRGYEDRPIAQEPLPAPQPSRESVTTPPAERPAPRRRERERDPRPVVVLDPGHGGEEKGAEGPSGLLEKDVTLDVAQRLRTRLESAGVRVVLTRDRDGTLSLAERTALANHHGADLFVSIHANASRRQDAKGAETYFLSYKATDAEAQALAALENAAGGGARQPSGGNGLNLVLWDMAQAAHLRGSSALAEMVQAELNALLSLRNRGVKQAPFRVLMGANMPAILIEVGFITNPDEEEKLRSPAYRESLALAISQSIDRFQQFVLSDAGRAGGGRTGTPH